MALWRWVSCSPVLSELIMLLRQEELTVLQCKTWPNLGPNSAICRVLIRLLDFELLLLRCKWIKRFDWRIEHSHRVDIRSRDSIIISLIISKNRAGLFAVSLWVPLKQGFTAGVQGTHRRGMWVIRKRWPWSEAVTPIIPASNRGYDGLAFYLPRFCKLNLLSNWITTRTRLDWLAGGFNIVGSVGVDFEITVAHPGILPTIVTNEELEHTLIEGRNHLTRTIDISYICCCNFFDIWIIWVVSSRDGMKWNQEIRLFISFSFSCLLLLRKGSIQKGIVLTRREPLFSISESVQGSLAVLMCLALCY